MNLVISLLYFLSLIGLGLCLKSKGFSSLIIPFLSISISSLVLYYFALINILFWGIFLNIILGMFFLIKYRTLFQFKFSLYNCLFLFYVLIIISVLYKSNLSHYDNFSHWATIVKFVSFEHRLPNSSDTLISFTSYPPITALTISPFTLNTANIRLMLIVQFTIIVSAQYTFLGAVRDKKRFIFSACVISLISLSLALNQSIRLNNLLVDYLLPMVTVASIANILNYSNDNNFKKTLFSTTILTSYLFLIKSSSIFFVLIVWIFFLYKFRCRLHTIVGICLSIITFGLWQLHVKLVFTKSSKHQINFSAYKKMFVSEGNYKKTQVINKIIKHTLDLYHNQSTFTILLMNIIIIFIAVLCIYKKYAKPKLFSLWCIINLIYITYWLLVLALYLVSMPFEEAIILSGYDRYMSSVTILITFFLGFYIMQLIDGNMWETDRNKRSIFTFKSLRTKSYYQYSTLVLLIFSILGILSESSGTKFQDVQNLNSFPVKMGRNIKENIHYNDRNYLLVDKNKSEVDSYYASYVGKYYLFSSKVTAISEFMMGEKEFRYLLDSYDYIVIPENHYTFNLMVSKFLNQKNIGTGIYQYRYGKLLKVKDNNKYELREEQ